MPDSYFFPCHFSSTQWKHQGRIRWRTPAYGVSFKQGTFAELYQNFLQQGFPFALIEETDSFLRAAVDSARSIPLFYYWDGKQFAISDNAVLLARHFGVRQCRKECYLEWRHIYCVLGNETLLPFIFQLLPYQRLTYHKRQGQLAIEEDRTAYQGPSDRVSWEVAEKSFVDVMDASALRALDGIAGRPVLIPLSGGYDSRLLAVILRKAGVKELIAYTYGMPGSPEVNIAYRVAKQLNIQWHFVSYSPEMFRSYLTRVGKAYDRFASQYAGVAHEQDFFAVEYLLRHRLIPCDGVVVSGMCTGAQNGIPMVPANSFPEDVAGLAEWIVKQPFFPKRGANQLKQRIARELIGWEWHDAGGAQNVYEWWRNRNRLAKFSVNSVRVFDFWGLRWLLPFWDDAVVRFWYSLPYVMRRGRRLFLQAAFRHYFRPWKVDFPASHPSRPQWLRWLGKWIKQCRPRYFQRRRWVDPNGLWHFADLLARDVGLPSENYANENEVHALWFLHRQCPPY